MTAATPPLAPEMVNARIQNLLKRLRLPTIARHYETLARQAAAQDLSYAHYLLTLLEEEGRQREVNRRQRLLRQARFPIPYTLDAYDFTAIPSLPKQKVLELVTGAFTTAHENVILVGAIGTGKTHIATALGHALCNQGLKVRFYTAADLINQLLEAHEQRQLSRLQNTLLKQQLVIIDELGFIPFSQQGAQMLFTLISDLYLRTSILITTNLPFSEWGQVFQDDRLLGALLDRLTHRCHILEFRGESHRFKESHGRRSPTSTLEQPSESPDAR